MADGFDVMTGGAMAVRPDGTVIAGPLADEETILYAEVSPISVLAERDRLDPAGHYFRPDLFSVRVNNARLEALMPALAIDSASSAGNDTRAGT